MAGAETVLTFRQAQDRTGSYRTEPTARQLSTLLSAYGVNGWTLDSRNYKSNSEIELHLSQPVGPVRGVEYAVLFAAWSEGKLAPHLYVKGQDALTRFIRGSCAFHDIHDRLMEPGGFTYFIHVGVYKNYYKSDPLTVYSRAL